MLPDEGPGRLPHTGQVEPPGPGEHEPANQWVGRARVVDPVHIAPPPGRVPGIKPRRGPPHLTNHDLRPKPPVQRPPHPFGVKPRRHIRMHHLPPGMHPSISSPRSHRHHRALRHPLQRSLQLTLHRPPVPLPGKPREQPPVIRNNQPQPPHPPIRTRSLWTRGLWKLAAAPPATSATLPTGALDTGWVGGLDAASGGAGRGGHRPGTTGVTGGRPGTTGVVGGRPVRARVAGRRPVGLVVGAHGTYLRSWSSSSVVSAVSSSAWAEAGSDSSTPDSVTPGSTAVSASPAGGSSASASTASVSSAPTSSASTPFSSSPAAVAPASISASAGTAGRSSSSSSASSSTSSPARAA